MSVGPAVFRMTTALRWAAETYWTNWCWSPGSSMLWLFFFFQAEDGIRDYKVTGVQTCALPISPGSFTVGFVGSMKPWHGLDVLVEAFARLHERAPDARLLLVGDGPARAAVCADLSARGLAGVVHCTEAVAPHEVPGLLTSVDAAVAPYPRATGFYFSPLKVYEYMAAGRAGGGGRAGQ